MTIVEWMYLLCMTLLSVYGFNSLWLTWIYLRHRQDPPPELEAPDEWPRVTVQLPIYNELHTVERLLQASMALDYPRDRLEIQLLDDSTDETRRIAARAVQRCRSKVIDIVHLTRRNRAGFKAGALAAGLGNAKGELLAVFDADFVPQPDYLREIVPHFADPNVGCVQTRWGYLNRDYSLLTQAQALGVDGHFVVEQTARSRAGLFINFNGTAGVWRRACIEDAGGWTADTLTEDLDLSYRAQLRGWRIEYRPDVVVPAELPAQISAFKRQQARWAQGSIQTAIKLLRPLLRSAQPWMVKLEGTIHLTGYMVHPLMLLMVLLTLPVSLGRSWVLSAASWLMSAAIGPPFLYAVAQVVQGENWRRRLRALPLLVLLGTGIALSNTLAVLKALLGVEQSFQRTPKFALREVGDRWVQSIYALNADALVWGELGLTVLALAVVLAPGTDHGALPWMILYASGFAYVASVNLLQTFQRQRWLATLPRSSKSRLERTR